MLKKVRFILLFISISVCLCIMSNTYSRYIVDTTGNIAATFSKWQILINNNDISSNTSSSISFTPVILENANVKENTIAPSSKGYFDIEVDPTNTEVSFKYTINLEIANTNIPDLMITKYAIIKSTYIEGDPLDFNTITDNTITADLIYDNNIANFKFDTFTIRIYFEWFEGENETMDDTADTEVAVSANENDTKFVVNAGITFEQIFE